VLGPSGGWLLGYLDQGFTLFCFGPAVTAEAIPALGRDAIPCKVVQVGRAPAAGACVIEDTEGLVARRYDARPGTCYLLRPDQHVCARWRAFDLGAVRAAIARAVGEPAQAAKAAA
jgi:3-(3-hydroxy-phenyl)propionate hydroxylase